MTTYPRPTDPVSGLTRPQGTTEAHSTDHGRIIGLVENVVHFGADPTGVADSTDAIEAAIAACEATGKTLFWPGGLYRISRTLDLSDLERQHWVGGHNAPHSGTHIQFTMPPQAMIYGADMADGAGPAVYADGGASLAGGDHTFENITFFGHDQGFHANQMARVKFINCGFKSNATSGTDVCGLFMSRSFWFHFESCAFHNTNGTSGPAVIFRAEAGLNAQNCGLMSFDWCVWAGGANQFDINVVPPEDVGVIQFYECVTEGTSAPFITFTEGPGLVTAYSIIQMRFDQTQIADSLAGSLPIVELNAPHATLRYPILVNTSLVGTAAIHVTAGAVRGGLLQNAGGTVQDGSGNLTGQAIYYKNNGLSISGDSENAAQSFIGYQGPAISLGKSGELHASYGVDVTGIHTWGPGGAGGGWDTNLYRSAADTLKTDDALHVAATLRHLGSTLGFFNHAASAQPAAYTVTNPTTDRALNVTGDTLAQVAEVLGTLIADLQSLGLIG